MEKYYLMVLEVFFQKANENGHYGFGMQEGLFHTMENAKAHVRKMFPEANEFVDDQHGCKTKFVLKKSIREVDSGKILVNAGDRMRITIEETTFLD